MSSYAQSIFIYVQSLLVNNPFRSIFYSFIKNLKLFVQQHHSFSKTVCLAKLFVQQHHSFSKIVCLVKSFTQ